MEPKKEELVLYGCGRQAEKFIRAYPDTTIEYCLDDTLHGRKFYDWPIYKPLDRVEDLRTKYTVVFTDNTSVYGRISREFQRAGLREFEHFIPHSLFRKKMALTWGNCHVEYVKNFLLYSGEFASCYGFYPKKKLWDMREEDFDMEIFRHCDLLICQHIRERNSLSETFSSANVESVLKEDCRIIKFPNLFGLPQFLFPQTDMEDMYVRSRGGIKWYRDRNVDSYLEGTDAVNLDELWERVQNVTYLEEELWEKYLLFCEKLTAREKQCNIHIMDYVMAHLGEEKLFLDVEHPSKGLLGEIGNRILEYLGYKRLDGSLVLPDVYAHEVFTYPFIKKAFHMKWKDGDLKADNQGEKLIPVYMDVREYLRQYCMIYKDEHRKSGKNIPIYYSLLVEDPGNRMEWQAECTGGSIGGTTRQGRKCYALKVRLKQKGLGVEYRAFLYGHGWTNYVPSGHVCGMEEGGSYIQAVQMRLTGEEAVRCHIYYQVHCQRTGWSEQYQDGAKAGNAEGILRMEAIKIEVRMDVK
jgi:hypothetical protein